MKSLQSMGSAVVEVFDKSVPPTEDLVREKVRDTENLNMDDSFFLIDLGEISRRLDDWRRLLPRVAPFYALKCNSDPDVARFLADLGIGFDCASKQELEQILSLGVHPSRIVYANPCKMASHLRYAGNKNVTLMTFDSTYELTKIKKHCPQAKLILRIHSSKEFDAVHNFNKKFGCHPNAARALLVHAKHLGLNVVGVSFHVGSLPSDVQSFSWVIRDADHVCSMAENMGFKMEILDIGGGFPGKDNEGVPFTKIAAVVNEALDQYFPPTRGARIIAEPGRYFVTSAFTLAVNVYAKRVVCKKGASCNHNGLTQEDVPFVPPDPFDEMTNRIIDVTAPNDVENGRLSASNPFLHMDKEDHDVSLIPPDSSVPPSDSIDLSNQHAGDAGVDWSSGEDGDFIYMYFLADGIFGSFNNVFTDHAKVTPLLVSDPLCPTLRPSVLWGPTCDGQDCVMSECSLPELDVGQWLYFHDMGAYTVSLASDFNGISRPRKIYLCSQEIWDRVYPVDCRLVNEQSKSSENLAADGYEPEIMRQPLRRQRTLSYRLSLNKGE